MVLNIFIMHRGTLIYDGREREKEKGSLNLLMAKSRYGTNCSQESYLAMLP